MSTTKSQVEIEFKFSTTNASNTDTTEDWVLIDLSDDNSCQLTEQQQLSEKEQSLLDTDLSSIKSNSWSTDLEKIKENEKNELLIDVYSNNHTVDNTPNNPVQNNKYILELLEIFL
ncbi:7069_t:CDS:1 [Diversispora eburnea]|uniref:7069_t:CDS:1 n=1 Tax=Diversispora eburnea TaxID=1213867 RepID=A0A9N8UVI6_9GLOM|nr:7069_t:CDS:1 [Diversispora eburnea]